MVAITVTPLAYFTGLGIAGVVGFLLGLYVAYKLRRGGPSMPSMGLDSDG